MATVELSFTPLPAHVRTARLVATAVARRSGVDEPLLDEVRLAVGEACSRAVEAHRQHCPAEPVRIELSNDGGRFQVVVTDTAPGNGHPLQSPAEPLASSSPSPLAVPESPPEPVVPVLSAPVPGFGEASAAGGAGAEPGDGNALTGAGDGLPPGVGLAVISGLADDVQISATNEGVSIRMSWPVPGN